MGEPQRLDISDAPQIAAFTRVACPFDPLSTRTVERGIFHEPTDPHVVTAMYETGLEVVGAAVVRGDRGWIKFLAVHPRARLAGAWHRRG